MVFQSVLSVAQRHGEERVLRSTFGGGSDGGEGCSSPASLKSFFTDATGGYPGGVWYSSLPLRDRAASDQGPGHLAVLMGSSLHGGPQCSEPSNTARTATSVALVTQRTCHAGTLRIVRMALLTEPVPRSVRQV